MKEITQKSTEQLQTVLATLKKDYEAGQNQKDMEAANKVYKVMIDQIERELKSRKLDYSKIEIVEIDGIDHKDYPDYCDAYISAATVGGVEATDEQLDEMNNNPEFRYNSVIESIH
tara:strand:- start:905 stop:1252 length:348 start_codon:yes stop_codon:yes gene_type:complete